MHTPQLEKIITGCKANERSAQYELYQLYSKAMYNVCVRMMNDEMLAEDMLQVAFVKVFSNIDSYKKEATIGAWIKRIMINTCLNEIGKKKMLFQTIDDKDYVDGAEEEKFNGRYDMGRIQNAIQLLPEGYRVIFSMYAIEGYDHQEIAQVMGISEGTSKSQYSRAKAKLKEFLKDSQRISNIS